MLDNTKAYTYLMGSSSEKPAWLDNHICVPAGSWVVAQYYVFTNAGDRAKGPKVALPTGRKTWEDLTRAIYGSTPTESGDLKKFRSRKEAKDFEGAQKMWKVEIYVS